MAGINEIDRAVLDSLSGGEKLKALLTAKGWETLRDFARAHNVWVEDVSACIRGARPLPEVREVVADALGLSRAQVDELIDGGPSVAADH